MVSHKDLKVWQKGIDLVVLVYQITQSYPKEEIYALTNQMRRCASSIPANIAEGSGRRNVGELTHFLYIALGSASELETFLVISEKLGYLEEENKEVVLELLNEVMKMLVGLIRQLNINNNNH
ncbi:MAG: four helix bundle protein [Bacteroidaceae bacterium]|nr:four helix bundle protein [Bacteroidaceae bacterium]